MWMYKYSDLEKTFSLFPLTDWDLRQSNLPVLFCFYNEAACAYAHVFVYMCFFVFVHVCVHTYVEVGGWQCMSSSVITLFFQEVLLIEPGAP